MIFLPIVDRELGLAARRRSTYRLRWWTALIGSVVAILGLFMAWASSRRSGGHGLFTALTAYEFGLCLLAGVFLTADCLSEEKREGTLGLLFLTDLKGYDVVLGKFMAISLHAFYSLLALLPLTALPLLIGGVTGAEFWRMALALVNSLFVSLTVGICVSAFAHDSQRALGNTFALLFLLIVCLPLIENLGSMTRVASAWWYGTWVSPYFPFSLSVETMYYTRAGKFWSSLAASHLFGWLMLVLASYALPHRWQERRARVVRSALTGRKLSPRALASRAALRRRLLGINPVLWLIGDTAWLRTAAWVLVGIWGCLIAAAWSEWQRDPGRIFVGSTVVGILLNMLLAIQACRFFAEARRNGSLEMLFTTPLTSADILEGQWLALRRLFLGPMLAFCCVSLVPALFSIWYRPDLGAIFSRGGHVLAGIGWFGLNLAAAVLAVCWYGMWLSLSMKRPKLAPALTILLTLLLPVVLCWLGLLVQLVFILRGRMKLQQDFRRVLWPQYFPARFFLGPVRVLPQTGGPPAVVRR